MSEAAVQLACTSCGTPLSGLELACPSCRALVHAAKLKAIAAQAQDAETRMDPASALVAWQEALRLLPPESRQHEEISRRIATLSKPAAEAPAKTRRGPIAGIGAAILVALSKAKLLLLGLGKVTTILSMLASFGVYWSVWGWKYAAGFVACIYVHEMGHVWELRKAGLPATAPMFIPGLGAFVRLKARPTSVYEDSRVGLAGPWWGLGASVAAAAIGYVTNAGIFWAIGVTSAVINVFNLLPIASLDGSRGFRSLSRVQRAMVAGACFLAGIAIAHGGDERNAGMLYLVGIVGAVRAFMRDANPEGDLRGLASFLALVGLLAGVVLAAHRFAAS